MEAPELVSYPRTPYSELLTYFKHGISKEVILPLSRYLRSTGSLIFSQRVTTSQNFLLSLFSKVKVYSSVQLCNMGISLRLEKRTSGSTEQKVFAIRAIRAVRAVYTNDESNNNAVAYPLNPHSNSQKNEKINPR